MACLLTDETEDGGISSEARRMPVSVAQGKTPPSRLGGIVHILTCGSVDDGKSTLIGRLLWDASDLPEDQRDMVRAAAVKAGHPERLDYSLLLDGLLAEREQGITIDIAWRYMDTMRRRFVLIDSPGHHQYTRNMASGASHADVGVMLVDARHGPKEQTRRHAALLHLMGVKQTVLAVNKMDLVGWSDETFRSIEDSFKSITSRLGFQQAHAIPISARHGDNVVLPSRNMPWYQGKTLSAFLEDVPSRKSDSRLPFRLPVQTVLRDGHGFRALAGTIASGFVRAGDEVVDSATGLRAKIARIATMDGDLETASAGMAISLVLDKDLDISRGAVLSTAGAAPIRAYRLEARLIWLSSRPFDPGRRLLLRTATDLVPVTSIGVTAHLDLETLHMTPASACVTNQIAAASIALGKTTAVDVFGDQGETGTFLLVDLLTGETLAAGVIAAATEESAEVKSSCFHLTRDLLSGLCADLGRSDMDVAEYRRRAHEVLRLFENAGVAAVLDGDSFEAGAEERVS